MAEGGHDGWAGMADWRERRGAGMAGGRERRGGGKDGLGGMALLSRPMAIACGRVLPYSWLINSSFPRKRESRGLCDRKAGIGRTALDSRSPMGVGDELRGNDARRSGFPLSRE